MSFSLPRQFLGLSQYLIHLGPENFACGEKPSMRIWE